MKHHRFFGSAALLALAACAQGSAIEQKPVSAPLAEAPYVAPPLGQQSTWLTNDGTQKTWTVIAVNDEHYEMRSDRGEQNVQAMPFMAALSWMSAGESGNSEIAGDPRSLFPLRVGKEVEWTREGVNNGESFSSNVRCTVADEVRVAVPAGEFDTFKVVCVSGGDLDRPYRTSTYFFSPSSNISVRYVNDTRDNRNEADNQLVALSVPD